MKRRMRSILLTLLAAVMALGTVLPAVCPAGTVLPAAVAATVQQDTSLVLSFEVNAVGTVPSPMPAFTFRLTGLDGAPMPEDAEGDTYDLKVEKLGTASFPAIAFTGMGLYEYTLAQVPGNSADVEKYDDTVYRIKVYVLRDEETNSLYLVYSIRNETTGEKVDVPEFENRFRAKGYTVINQAGDTFD